MIAFRMPSLGADMDAGTLVEWLKQPGEAVKRGEVIAVVETQKGAIEIETFDDGVLDNIIVQPGTEVPVGTVLAEIREPGAPAVPKPGAAAKAPEAPPPPPAAAAAPASPLATGAPAAPAPPVASGLRVTPAARAEATRRGIDLTSVAPGPQGVIGLAELAAARSSAETPAAAPRRAAGGLDLAAMRKAIAAAMARSKREIPHYYVARTVDVSPLMQWLEACNAARPPEQRLLYAVPLLKALALALAKAPALNGRFEDGAFTPSEAVHVGVATAIRGGGLIAPAIHDIARLDLDELMTRLRDLVGRVRGGRLKGSEMRDPTITLSSLGEGGGDAMWPVIYPPQVAIVGVGAVLQRPWVVDGRVEARRVMTITVAGDHRASDGRLAARFLEALDGLLQRPEEL